jgi:Tfp pilus assembly protein PilF
MKVISAIVGIVLLGASFILASLASSNATEMIAKQDAIVMKYIAQSDEAMAEEDFKSAIKFVKLAIQVDPKSKKAFKAYETIMEAKYKPAQSDDEDSSTSTQESPSDDEEEEEDMGC